jgi:hypothetical protein
MTGTDHRRRFAARLLLGTGERHEEDDAEQVQAGCNDAKTPAPMIAQFRFVCQPLAESQKQVGN